MINKSANINMPAESEDGFLAPTYHDFKCWIYVQGVCNERSIDFGIQGMYGVNEYLIPDTN